MGAMIQEGDLVQFRRSSGRWDTGFVASVSRVSGYETTVTVQFCDHRLEKTVSESDVVLLRAAQARRTSGRKKGRTTGKKRGRSTGKKVVKARRTAKKR